MLVQNSTDLEWLVEISRAKPRCIIITEDKDKLIRNLNVNLGKNPSALLSVRTEQLAELQVAQHLQENFTGLLAQKCVQEGTLRQCRTRVQNYSQQNELSQRERHALDTNNIGKVIPLYQGVTTSNFYTFSGEWQSGKINWASGRDFKYRANNHYNPSITANGEGYLALYTTQDYQEDPWQKAFTRL